jgi:hypothetical protein
MDRAAFDRRKDFLPGRRFVDIADDAMRLRMVTSAEGNRAHHQDGRGRRHGRRRGRRGGRAGRRRARGGAARDGREAALELREDVETAPAPGMAVSMEPMIMIPDGEPGAGGVASTTSS